jgi:YD repeat-containing protein
VIAAPGGVVACIENDALGRPVKIIDPEGGETSYTYGPFGGLLSVLQGARLEIDGESFATGVTYDATEMNPPLPSTFSPSPS